MAYTEDIHTDHAWRSRAHEFYYPQRNLTALTVTVPTAKNPIGRPWETHEEFVRDLKVLRELTVANTAKGQKHEKRIELNKHHAKYPLRTILPDLPAKYTEKTISSSKLMRFVSMSTRCSIWMVMVGLARGFKLCFREPSIHGPTSATTKTALQQTSARSLSRGKTYTRI